MEKYYFFPSNKLDLTLKKAIPFYYDNKKYQSIGEFINGDSKSIPECNQNNLLKAENGLIEMLKQHKQLRDCVLSNEEHKFAYSMTNEDNWSIGLKKNDPLRFYEKNWNKKNHFGEIMTKVKKYLIENPKIYAKNQEHESKSNSKVIDEHSFDWRVISKNIDEKFTYFWRADSPFSQHHPTKFNLDGHTFNCAEQYYMYMKAVTFKDDRSKWQILECNNPMKQKSIGRGVYNFDANYWDKIAKDVVFKGNIAKFSQNSRILKLLLMTDGTTLVEASPKDDKWGVNLEADDVKIFHRQTWKGTNWLGETLTKVRQHFIDEGTKCDYNFEYLNPDCYISFSKSASPFHYTHMCFFEVDGIPYSSLNHYLVHMAAELFNHVKIIDDIKSCLSNKRLNDLYSNIHNFNQVEFNKHLNDYLLIGNYHKFHQNKNLMGQLLDTGGCIIVFKDSDQTLGTGSYNFEEEDILKDNWKGQNLLGYSLTFLRDKYLSTNGDYRPGKLIDYSMYKGIRAVPYNKSQNYRKRMDANNYMNQNNSSQSFSQIKGFQPHNESNNKAPRGRGQSSSKNFSGSYSNDNQHYGKPKSSIFKNDQYDTKRAKIDEHSDSQFTNYMDTNHIILPLSGIEQPNNEDLIRSRKPDPFENGEEAFVTDEQAMNNLQKYKNTKIIDNLTIKQEDISNLSFNNFAEDLDKKHTENIQEKIENANLETTKHIYFDVDDKHYDQRNVENHFKPHKNQIDTQIADNLQTNSLDIKNSVNYSSNLANKCDRNINHPENDAYDNVSNLNDNYQSNNGNKDMILFNEINSVNIIKPSTSNENNSLYLKNIKSVNTIKNINEHTKFSDKDDIKLKVENACESHQILDNDYKLIDNNTVTFDNNSIFSPTSSHPIKINNIEFPTVNHYIYWKRAEIYELDNLKEEILSYKKSIALNKKFEKEFKYENDNVDLNKWCDEAERILEVANLEKVKIYEIFKEKLLDTKGYEIKYLSHFETDNFIGAGTDLKGDNLLGKVLMKIRDDILKQN